MSGGGYFGFTPAGSTQYNTASAGYGGSFNVGYAAPAAYGYTTAAPASNATYTGYTGATAPQASAGVGSAGYAQRIDTSTFSSGAANGQRGAGGTSFKAPAPRTQHTGSAGAKGSSYTGYDAAVYAAATSYLQSKATGGGSQWLGLKKSGTGTGGPGGGGGGGGGRGSFPRKTTGPPRGGGVQQLHYCDVCKISCAGPQTYREHLEGQKHKKKEASVKTGGSSQPLARSKASFRCDLCQVTCTGSDTYAAHVRGAKHQKTLKLHQTLGKPIPSSEPTVIPPAGGGGEGSPAAKKVVGVAKTNFVGAGKLTSTATGVREVPIGPSQTDGETTMAEALAMESNVQPVGGDYVESVKDHTGKVVQFFCKLCDCKFNDLNAKDMHLKGRRHRLQFKKKVNPELEVDFKPMPGHRNRRQSEEKLRKELMRLRQQELWSMRSGPPRAMYQNQMMGPSGPPKPLFGGGSAVRTSGETMDDRHTMVKHNSIYPTEEELNAVQNIVTNLEKALKGVSDQFAEEEEKKKKEAEGGDKKEEEKKEDEGKKDAADEEDEAERILKGVMRVGLLAKSLLLRGDLSVQLVVLCSDKPTRALLQRVKNVLPKQLEAVTEEKYSLAMAPEKASLLVCSAGEPKAQVHVVFTSVAMREDGTGSVDPPDVLDRQKCLEALADLRHAKWFQARCTNLQSCLITLRIMRDICQRIPTWAPISNWALELLVEKVLTSAGVPLSPGDALRRIFEAVASGILLPNGPGLLDPCEKEVSDSVGKLTPQQREDITSSAQHALRLIAFNQLYKILGIDRLPDRIIPAGRKRPRESTDSGETQDTNGKKDKKDDAPEPGEVVTAKK